MAWGDSNYIPIGGYYYNEWFGYFYGHVDGGNHVVSGIRVYRNNNDVNKDRYQGLFGYIGDSGHGTVAEVKNFILADAQITGYVNVGGIVGDNSGGRIENCHVLSDVIINTDHKQGSTLGGIAGENEGTITGCSSAASIIASGTANWTLASIAGYNHQGC